MLPVTRPFLLNLTFLSRESANIIEDLLKIEVKRSK